MKILYVSGDADYSATSFEDNFGGTKVIDIIKSVESGEDTYLPTEEQQDDYEDWSLDIVEVGDIDLKFLNFVRTSVQDYDDSKHRNFYLENEII